MNMNHRPDVTRMSYDELKQYGRSGRAQDIEVAAELIRRHRQSSKWRFLTEGPDNVVPFCRPRRVNSGEGGAA